ncbi:hypothetical protein RSAG8_02787, partial [Rhizoctonia solani AG-8 WAC10335]
MSFQIGAKQALQQIEGDIKRPGHNDEALFKDSKRTNTPSGTLSHINSLVDEQVGNGIHRGLLPTKAPTSPLIARLPHDTTSGAESRLERFTQATDPSELDLQHHALGVGVAAPTDHVAFELRDVGNLSLGTNVVPSHTGGNEAGFALGEPPSQTPEVVADAPWTNWKELKEFARVLAPVTNLFGPIREMAELFVECVDKCEMAGEAKTEYEALRVRIEELFEDLNRHFGEGPSLVMTSSMESLCKSIQAELNYIKKQQDRNMGERDLSAADDSDKALACYRRIEGHIQRLSLNTNLSMWGVGQEQAGESRADRMTSRIEHLPASFPAWYNSAEGIGFNRRECTPATRVNVLANPLDWAHSGGGGVYWLSGMAGTGKTTIAYSVCAELDISCQLGASFFCSRLREECRNVNKIIPSIAYQLARFSRPFQSVLSAALEYDPGVHGRLPHMQFDALIAKPMLEVQHTLPEELIVVIDALDECEQKESTGSMLDVLLSNTASLPIKFIVSSRPEPQIRDQMARGRAKPQLVLHELEKGLVRADVESYLREGLAQMSPSEAQIAALVEKASISFIYAATAVRHIGYDNFKSDPEARLHAILTRPNPWKGGVNEIDQLYTTVLEATFENRRLRKVERDTMQQVLYTIVCAREPLTVSGLSELLQIHNADRVRGVLRLLWSILHLVGESELVTTLHTSFPDFMLDPARSKAYHCNVESHNRTLTEHCFRRISQTQPQFNICGLETSYLLDEEVPNLEERVARVVSSGLSYACRHWADHLSSGGCSQGVIEQLNDFLSARLLLWMEVMNLKKQMKTAGQCMKLTVDWCNQYEGSLKLASLAHDAKNFVEAFASNPVSQSTPHIYISSLQLCPRSSIIYRIYSNYVENLLKPHGRVGEHRGVATSDYEPWKIGSGVLSIAYSPDETRVAVGCENGTVNICDARNGSILTGPLSHKWGVNCVAFSPDGTSVASGANDHTVRLWGLVGDTPISRLFKDHTNAVMAITFTPDGTRLVSGSVDCTICIRNTHDGSLTTHLLQGCTHLVYSVAISPDGSYVASGAADSTIRIWGIDDGQLIAGPFVGHSSSVRSVIFSPSGSHILSGSHDQSIRIWDVQRTVVPHLLGASSQNHPSENHAPHNTRIEEIADSERIHTMSTSGSTCSKDHTVQVWTIHQAILPPLSHGTCPSILVASFAWLLDGPHLAYCSRPNGDAIISTNGSFTHNPGHQISRLLEGWKYRSDGWVVNGHTQPLFWAPSPSVALRIINRALFVITAADSKALLWFSELKLGNWWQESHIWFVKVSGELATNAEAIEPVKSRSGSKPTIFPTCLNRLVRKSLVQK